MKNLQKNKGSFDLSQTEQEILSLSEMDIDQVRDERLMTSYSTYHVQKEKFVVCSTFSKWSCKNCFLLDEDGICEIKAHWEITRWDYDHYDVVLVEQHLYNLTKDGRMSELYDAVDIANTYFEDDVTTCAKRVLAGDPYSPDFINVEYSADTRMRLSK